MIHIDVDSRIRWHQDGSVLQKPVEIRVSHFHEGAVREFLEQLDAACCSGQPVVPITVDSSGGAVHGLLAMMDALDSVRGQIVISTIASGKAFSAGAVLLSAGDNGVRFASSSSSVMIHEMSSYGGGKSVDVQADAKESARLNRILFERLDKNCGHESGYFADLVHTNGHADVYMTPKMALKHSLINEVGIPQLAMIATVDYAYGLPSKPPPHKHSKNCQHAEGAK